MAGNTNLLNSSRDKQDEFYTNLPMIEDELKYYKDCFKGKTVLCNCDDPFESNFFKFFVMNFNSLGLKKLISTCFDGSTISQTQLSLFETEIKPQDRTPYKVEITSISDVNNDGRVDLSDVEQIIKENDGVLSILKGNGDFRSSECIELMKEADIICTNPPFSLFSDFVVQIMKYNKQFLIIGNLNNITYKEITPFIKENKIWLGHRAGHFWFRVPDYYENKETDFKIDKDGIKWRRMGNICWFTNLPVKRSIDETILYKKYNPEEYPKYDNIDAIHVQSKNVIPDDYFGLMAVPLDFLTKYNPEQFDVLGIDKEITNDHQRCKLNGKVKFARLIIKRKV